MIKKEYRTISKKHRDIAMRAICEYNRKHKPNHYITADYLYSHGLPRSVDADQVAETLESMNLITYESKYPDEAKRIEITLVGKHYFESAADDESERRKQRSHDWRIAVFSAVSGAFLSKPLWDTIAWLVHLFSV